MVDELPLHPRVRILAERGDGLVVLEKPEGVLTHPNRQADEKRSLLVCHYERREECFRWGPDGRERLWLAHRLDGATSGVLVAAREKCLAERLKEAFAGRRMGKTYVAVVFGKGPEGAEVWQDGLVTERAGGQLRSRLVRRAGGVARAVTRVRGVGRTLGSGMEIALVEMEPETGRPHQLRVQSAGRGWPMVGDQTYGDFRLNRLWVRGGGGKRLYLHAWKLRLPPLGEGSPGGVFAAGWPEAFAAAGFKPRSPGCL